MKHSKRLLISLAIILLIISLACNLTKALFPENEEPEDAPIVEEQPSEILEEEPEELVENTPISEPTAEPVLDQTASWLIALGEDELLYMNTSDGIVHTVETKNVYGAYPSPTGGKVALLRAAEGEYMYWLDLLDLATEEMITITPLLAQSFPLNYWDTAASCEPTGEAIKAIWSSEPFWSNDGSALVFISGHDGGYAHPFTYFPAENEILKHAFGEMGEDSHFFDPMIGGDGGLTYTVNAASCFTGNDGQPIMDAFWLGTPTGDFAVLLEELAPESNGVEVFGWISGMLAVYADKDGAFLDEEVTYHHLRAVNIYSPEITEITGIADHVTTVQVAQPFNSVAFITVDAAGGEKITEPGLYYWSVFDQTLVKLHDRVDVNSALSWNFYKTTYFAKVLNEQGEPDILIFLENGTEEGYWDVNAMEPPVFPIDHGAHNYYAWLDERGLFVQSFDTVTPEKLSDNPNSLFVWHPEIASLAYAVGNEIFRAGEPYFSPTPLMTMSEAVVGLYWVGP